ncbi:class F sortase [Streptomyces sp. NBC_00536]|uniref:class F sortase n=1 Tax=Streptomyces sp. NBC_00536 TaxID=2975769 RepID=UPI002E81AF7E|nr:class F sortase [Streptomyces sp. NBC_00536]WUC80099.1 class F sortase [Streptomyces sp. NBC_00536]
MTEPTAVSQGGRAIRVAALAGAAALAVSLVSGCSAASDSGKKSAPTPKAAPATAAPAPERIEIPDIKVDAQLETVGLDAKGVMQEPDFAKPMEAAWYKQGPAPGEQGPAAIVGHMDTPTTPEAVFFNLKKLTKDEKIKVHRADGTTVVFAVDRIETYKKDAFPTDKVYGDTADPELRLITCGGNLMKDRHWDSNVVVFAHQTEGA